MKNYFFIIIIAIWCWSCETPEAPEFRRVENIQIDILGENGARIEGDAVFFNPNTTRVKIKNVNLDVEVEDKKVASMDREYDIKVQGLKEFTVPLDVTVSLKELNMDLMNTALMLFGGEKKKVRYTGEVKINVYGFNYEVPIDYEDEIKIKL